MWSWPAVLRAPQAAAAPCHTEVSWHRRRLVGLSEQCFRFSGLARRQKRHEAPARSRAEAEKKSPGNTAPKTPRRQFEKTKQNKTKPG